MSQISWAEKERIKNIASSLTLEQFEHYDVTEFDGRALKRFIYNFYKTHPEEIRWNLSSWNVSNVEYMGEMFCDCHSLKTLDLSNWNVSKVKYMGNMFQNCSSLKTLNLSNWIVPTSTRMDSMFDGCPLLVPGNNKPVILQNHPVDIAGRFQEEKAQQNAIIQKQTEEIEHLRQLLSAKDEEITALKQLLISLAGQL